MPGGERTALVTGANRGLGRAVAGALCGLGYRVVVAARDPADAGETAADLGPRAAGVGLDVTVEDGAERARERIGPVDVLVNNAGVLLDAGRQPSTVPLDVAERTLTTNVIGTWRVTQAFLPGMVERGWGRVVMVSSGTGSFANGIFPGTPSYSLSKAGLNALTVMLAEETRGTGVLVNAVNPGLVRTRMMPAAERPPEDAADDVVFAVRLPDDGPTGAFLRSGAVIPW